MTDSRFQIHEGPPPPGFTSKVSEPIYYSDEYLTVQDHVATRTILLLDMTENHIVGKIIFSTEGSGKMVSMSKAPFGGLCHHADVSSEVLKWWLINIMEKEMVIRQPPPFYPHFFNPEENHGLSVSTTDLNHHIDLRDYHLGKLHNMQIRRIRKCKKAGYELEEVQDENQLVATYQFIAGCREEQGLVINISLDKFIRSFRLLPAHYQAFRIIDPYGEIIAATVVVKVTDQIVYNYLPASLRKFQTFSPMAFLLFRVALHYQREGSDILDLGLSSINGVSQDSLATFKERMGAIRTTKLTYQA